MSSEHDDKRDEAQALYEAGALTYEQRDTVLSLIAQHAGFEAFVNQCTVLTNRSEVGMVVYIAANEASSRRAESAEQVREYALSRLRRGDSPESVIEWLGTISGELC